MAIVLTCLVIAVPLGAGGVTGHRNGEPPVPATPAASHVPPAFLLQWGANGTGNGEFSAPHGVAAHASGSVYVSDQSDNRIQKFDSLGTYLHQWGSAGTAEGQFDHAFDVAVDSVGNVYVADADNHRLQKFDGNGAFLRAWGWGVDDGGDAFQICTSTCQAGTDGGGGGSLYFPNGVAVDSADKVYVGNWGNNRIVKYGSDGSYLTQWGTSGTAEGQFTGGPGDVAVDGDGFVITTEETNARVQVFDSSGNFVRMWGYGVSSGTANFEICTSGCQAGLLGTSDWQFSSPTYLAVDADGGIYVTDLGNSRVFKFDRLGNRLTNWDEGNGALSGPIGIDIVGSALYLVDRYNYRVIKYGGPYFETYVGNPAPGIGR